MLYCHYVECLHHSITTIIQRVVVLWYIDIISFIQLIVNLCVSAKVVFLLILLSAYNSYAVNKLLWVSSDIKNALLVLYSATYALSVGRQWVKPTIKIINPVEYQPKGGETRRTHMGGTICRLVCVAGSRLCDSVWAPYLNAFPLFLRGFCVLQMHSNKHHIKERTLQYAILWLTK